MLEKFLNNEGTERLTIEEQKNIDGVYKSPEINCYNPATGKEYPC